MEEKGRILKFPEPKPDEYIATVDDDNNITGFFVTRKRNNLGVNWVGVYQEFMRWIAVQGLTGEQYNVLMYMMSKLDFDNYLRITQKNVSEALGIRKENVSRSVKKLVELEILAVGPKVGTSKTYRLNPRMAHKGKNIKQTLIDFDDLVAARNARKGMKK